MAVKDTHKAFERLTGAGYSKEMTEALLELLSESWDDLATKTDLAEVKANLTEVKAELKADLKSLEKTTNSALREVELRMRLHLYAVALVVIGVLAALELLPR